MNTTFDPISPFAERRDLAHIASMIAAGSRVLDVGCGTGALLMLLKKSRNVDGRGMEISHNGVAKAVARGLSVVQGDADNDLKDYPDKAFDYIILTRTIQATNRPADVLRECLRVGHKVIVSFPNFGYWRIRFDLLFKGRMPRSDALPLAWYDTPNIHLCTIRDFVTMCYDLNMPAKLVEAYAASQGQAPRRIDAHGLHLAIANVTAEEAIFMIESVA